jgi:DNA-binding beta-propeller fold protein YncE
MLAPLFGLGLLIFVNNKRTFLDVVKTGALYAITLIPFFYVYFNNPGAIAGRFRAATNMSADKSYFQNALTVLGALLSDMSPTFFILEGDQHNRHHIPAMGEILIATFALGLLGIVIILIKHRGSRWWRYILYGSIACLLPGAVTYERHHAVRGIGFPIFFTLLTVPAIVWLLGSSREKAKGDGSENKDAEPATTSRNLLGNEGSLRRALLYCLLVLTLVQAIAFQVKFYEIGDDRSGEFDHPYLNILEMALATDSRPIYLDEGNEPAYVHALWYGTIKGLPRSNFYHLLDGQLPPYGGLVINSGPCPGECEVIYTEGLYTLYRSLVPNAGPPPEETPALVTLGSGPGQFSLPHGLTIDANGLQYVADTDNARIQKLDAVGKFVSEFGTRGTDQGQLSQPHGIAVNQAGEVFVTDSARHALLKFNADGQFVKEWRDPEVPFYGPRDIALAADGNLYIVDQGLARIVKFNTSTEQFTSWGTQGPAEGQFEGLTGVGVGGGFVFTTDAGSGRIQVFDMNGKFVRQWSVPQWQKDWYTFPDVAYDEDSKQVFVSSGKTNEVLVYDIEGQFLSSIKPQPPSGLRSPSSLEITKGPKGNRLVVLNISNNIASVGNPGIVMIDIAKTKVEKVR